MNKVPSWVLLAISVTFLVVGLGIYGVSWYLQAPEMPVGITVEAKPAKELAKQVTVPLVIDLVKVFPPEVKAKLKLPKEVVKDPTQHVVASSKIKGDEHPHTVTTTVDSATGEFTTYDRKDPLPWVAISTKTEVGAYYGIKDGEQAFRVEAKQELLQIKAAHIGATASMDVTRDETSGFVGVGAWVRW